ncbi:MAG: hypothetical protein R6X02_15345 [Enhygromyxa sp.]
MSRISRALWLSVPVFILCTYGCGDGGGDESSVFTVGMTVGGDGDGTSGDGDSGDGDGDGDGDSGDGDGDGEPDPCAGVDCSGHGSCFENDGAAACNCDSGYLADGIECIECSAINPQGFNITVPSIGVSGTVSITGVPSGDWQHNGAIYLVDKVTSDRFFLASTEEGNYSSHVVPGVYDVHYDMLNDAGSLPVPANNNARLMTEVDLTQSKQLNVTVPPSAVSGNASIAGVPSGDWQHNGAIYFVDLATSDRFFFASTEAGAYATHVVPGAYRVYYDMQNDGGSHPVPANNNAALMCVQIP